MARDLTQFLTPEQIAQSNAVLADLTPEMRLGALAIIAHGKKVGYKNMNALVEARVAADGSLLPEAPSLALVA